MRFYLLSDGVVLAEIEAESPFLATCDEQAEDAPRGTALVNFATGLVVARRADLAHQLVGWTFGEEPEATNSRSVA